MGLETGTYISNLVATNPVGATDARSQGDNHLRLIKSVLKNTFPNASKAFYFPNSVGEQTANLTPALSDNGKIYPLSADAAARTVTLPTDVPDGYNVTVVKTDDSANLITVSATGGKPINTAASYILFAPGQVTQFVYCETLDAWLALSVFARQGKVLIASGSVAAVSSLDLILPDIGASSFDFEYSNFTVSVAGDDLRVRFSTDGGSTFISTSTAYVWQSSSHINGATAPLFDDEDSGSGIQIAPVIDDTTPFAGRIKILAPLVAKPTQIIYEGAGFSSEGGYFRVDGAGQLKASSATNAVRFISLGSNLKTMDYALYANLG